MSRGDQACGEHGIEGNSAERDDWNWGRGHLGGVQTYNSGNFLESIKVTLMRMPSNV